MDVVRTLLFAVLVIVLLVAAGWLGKAYGRHLKAGVTLVGAALFGFGAVLDAPSRHAVESVERENEDEPGGEPKDL